MSFETTVVDNLRFSSDLSNLHLVESLIDKVCSELSIEEDLYGNILIAVTEAVNNAIIHGNLSDISKYVHIEVIDTPTLFSFIISDEGMGFDYNSLPDPTAPENLEKEHGRGIFLIKNLADDLVYSEKGNVATISFNK